MESRMCEFVNTYDENEHFESTSFLNKSKRHARSHSLGEVDGARPSVARVIPFGATIKRQKVPSRRSFRSPPLSSTLLRAFH